MQVVWNAPARFRRIAQQRRRRRRGILDRRRVLRMHADRGSGFPLDQLRRSEPAGVGGLGRLVAATDKRPDRAEARWLAAPARPAVLARA